MFAESYVALNSIIALLVSVALRRFRRLVEELEARKALKRLIADYSDDALLNLDAQGNIRFASPAGERMTGRTDLEGEPLGCFFERRDAVLVRAALDRAAAAPDTTESLERSVFRGGRHAWLEAKLRAVVNGNVLQGFAVTIRDVSARKQAKIDAVHAAETDQLTGLPNRRAQMTRLDDRVGHADLRAFSLAIIDLDHFKRVNDTHGHPAGDAVLKAVGEVMAGLAGPRHMLARLGGEEFALIANDTGIGATRMLCEDLRSRIAALSFEGADGQHFSLTASIGAARIDRWLTASEALQAADRLLYAAKDQGRDQVVASQPAEPVPLRRIA